MKWLWIFWSGYFLYILYNIYSYFKGKHLAANVDIYNAWYLKKLGIAIAILLLSIVLKYIGKVTIAKWVAGIPAVIVGGVVIAGVVAWLFTWFVMWLGKGN